MQRFSHLSQAVWIILSLCAILVLGIFMAQIPELEQAFTSMNDTLLLPWLVANGADHPLISSWVGILIVAGGLLFVNTVCCTWCKFVLRLRRGGGGLPKAQLLIIAIHVLLLFMLVGHVLNFTWGEKYPPFNLFAGQEHELGHGYSLKAEQLNLSVDPQLLRDAADRRFHSLSAEEFDVFGNTATLGLYHDGRLIARQEARFMGPLSHGPFKCIIKNFFAPPDGKGDRQVGLRVLVIRNPSAEPLFLLYILMIACTLAYAVLTWKKVPAQIRQAATE